MLRRTVPRDSRSGSIKWETDEQTLSVYTRKAAFDFV
jgi:hypothetical protein